MTNQPAEHNPPPEADKPLASDAVSPWFKPADALNDEQLEAMATLNIEALNPELPPVEPQVAGGWYTPPNAITLGEMSGVIDANILAGIQSAPTSATSIVMPDEPPADSVEEMVSEPAADEVELDPLDAPSAPVDFGQADFQAAPEAPVDEPEELGLGGLRDEVRVPTGLDPKAVRTDELVAPIVPARGYGGVSGGTASQETRLLSDTGQMANQTPLPSGTGAMPPVQPNPAAEKFRTVEQNVAILRQQYASGLITRPQLEVELKKLVVMDEQGRWWTIGVDSNRWYRYDGREWVPDTPPQTGASPAVSNIAPSSGAPVGYLPTETNVQAPQAPALASIELDDYGMPLPQRVPLDDPGATMVNLNAATSSSAEATWDATVQSPVHGGSEGIPSPMADVTMPSDAYSGATMAGATQLSQPHHEAALASPAIEQPNPDGATPAKKQGIHPDYSAAYGGFDRSKATKYAVWVGIGGVVVTLGMVLCVLLGMVAYYFSVVNQYQDRLDNLGLQAAAFQTTIIYDANGNVIAEYNDPNNGARTNVPLEDISPFVIHATIATEDETYYENPGFSVYAIVRAVYTNLRSEGPRSGASTITQQLVRALILDEDFAAEVSPGRKVVEIILAAELSRRYDKNEILQLYLNEIYYGNLAYGIEAAAQVYFGKSAAELNVYESAFLAGLPQAPAIYDPVRNRLAAFGRMGEVLRLMTEANGDGCIQMQHSNAVWDLSQPFCVTQEYLDPNLNPDRALELALVETRLFEPPANQPLYAHYVNWIWEQLEGQYDPEQIYSAGFRVYTTLDPDLQNVAQQAVVNQVNQARARGFVVNNGSVVAMDPRTGAVIAMVGSADFNNESIDGQVNVALTAQQPGSSIKPLVYLAAMEGNAEGEYWTPATVIWDTDTCWDAGGGQTYCPVNYDREYHGPTPLKEALANSLNITAVKALDFVGVSRFEERAEELGLPFPLQSPSDTAGLTTALGGAEVRLIDLVAVYSNFANSGQRFVPYGIERIETANGDVIYQHQPELYGLNINPAHAYLINNILSDDAARAQEFGRGSILNVPGREVAVKTGTTNENRDALTVGWSPQVIVGVWMGNTDNTPTNGATGFSLAAPVWNTVITAALQDEPVVAFPRPDTVSGLNVCRDTGAQMPAAGCGAGGVNSAFFYVNQPPPTADQGLLEVVLVDRFTDLRANQFCPDYTVEKTFLRVDDSTAIDWIRNTGVGQQWAAARGIDPNAVGTEPTGECQAGQAVPEVVLSSPTPSATISSLVPIYGVATVPNFSYYELQYASASDPENFIAISGQRRDLEQRNPNSFLGEWDTRSVPNGPYILRIVVVSQNGAQAEARIPVSVVNETAPPPPTQAPSDGDGTSATPMPTIDPNAVPTGEAVPSGETG